jgi:hypothetical protein
MFCLVFLVPFLVEPRSGLGGRSCLFERETYDSSPSSEMARGPALPVLCEVVGEEGLEPSNGGIKTRCLTTWRLPRKDKSVAWTRVPVQPVLGWSGVELGGEAEFTHPQKIRPHRRGFS